MDYSDNYYHSSAPTPTLIPLHPIVDDYIYSWHLRMTWIAFLTLWIFWSLVWIFRNFLINKKERPDLLEEVINTAAEASQKAMMIPAINEWPQRLDNAYQMVKDVLGSLLCLLSLNTVAHASSYGVMIIAWLIVAFAIFWCVVEMIIDNRILRLIYSIIFFALGLAFVGITFQAANF